MSVTGAVGDGTAVETVIEGTPVLVTAGGAATLEDELESPRGNAETPESVESGTTASRRCLRHRMVSEGKRMMSRAS